MAVAPYTLQQLLATMNLDAVRSKYLGALQGAGFPALTEWVPKDGVEMAYVGMVSSAVADLVAADLPALVAGGFLGLASTPSYGASDYLTLLASDFYQLDRVPASFTTFNLKLTASAAVPSSQTFQPGDIWVAGPSGRRYQSITGGVLQPGDPNGLVITFQAEAKGAAYNDSPQSMVLVTAPAGVTARAASGDFTLVTHLGGGDGGLLLRRTTPTTTPEPHSFTVRIESPGEAGVATYSLQTDGGVFVAQGPLLATGNNGAGGTTFDVIDGNNASSFVVGDTYAFATPAGSGYVQGSDDESDISLAARCRGRWPALSSNPTDVVFVLWARLAYPAASRIAVAPDPIVAGRVNMIAADSHGPLDAVGLQAITDFVSPRLNSVLDSFQAVAASVLGITASGSVLVPAANLLAVQEAANSAWVAYLGAVELGGIVRIAKLEEILMDAGATDVANTVALRLNSSTGNLQLAAGQVPEATDLGLAKTMTWVVTA